MIRDDGLIKLTDFGIAQIVDKERMTVTGQLLGSPAYMAPEHVEGRPLDFRTDVFAVGILPISWRRASCRFAARTRTRCSSASPSAASSRPTAVNPLVGKRLNRVIDRALQREPDARYSDVGADARASSSRISPTPASTIRAPSSGATSPIPKGWARAFQPRLVASLTRARRVPAPRKGARRRRSSCGDARCRTSPSEAAAELRTLVAGWRRTQRRAAAWRGSAIVAAVRCCCVAGGGARRPSLAPDAPAAAGARAAGRPVDGAADRLEARVSVGASAIGRPARPR